MKTRPGAFALALALCGCRSTDEEYRVSPEGAWKGPPLNGNTATCTFGWILESEYRGGKLLTSGPQRQTPAWTITFSDLDKPSPRVTETDAAGSTEERGWQAFATDTRISLVRTSDSEKNIFVYSIYRETAVAVLSELGPCHCRNGARTRGILLP